MDMTMILARIVHVLTGVFWVGTMVFMAAFLVPALRRAGPDSAKVMAALGQGRFMLVMPIVAILTMLSGLWLYWRVSVGFSPEYMRSGPGMVYGTGGALAILAFMIGIIVVRPAMTKVAALSQAAMSAEPGDREAIGAKAQALRMRGAKAGEIVAWLLFLATVAMAVGRYV